MTGGVVVAVGVAAAVVGVQTGDVSGPVPVHSGSASAAVTAVRLLRIMPLGTSSTVGAGSPATAGFRGPLEALLVADGIAFDMVGSQHSGPPSVPDLDHEGHGGWTMVTMQPLVAGWIQTQRPDVVLLQVGTNDLGSGASAATTAQRLDLMLTTIEATAPTYVVVAGVWAPLRTRAQARAQYPALAAAVVARHRALGQAMTWVDTSTLLEPGDLSDGLHPNVNGYRKIAATWEREIHSYVNRRHGASPQSQG